MHELSLAQTLLETVEAEARRRPGAHVVTVGVRVGELSGVDPEALSFSFEALVADTALAPLALAIERCPRRHRCPRCDFTFAATDSDFACPRCGSTPTRCVGGDELELTFLEVEEP
ncbi:MAG: hypothetical protein A2620_06220 [Acidobacteria bacterium RIFCSPHIGHO2_01_FULL_67_28]|nr:MAG: hypothetical protein A2620_06220 [Acidobacteria bacterium RIFCSPHIGHO2_01_FULL_67_28]